MYLLQTSTPKIEKRLRNFIDKYPAFKSKLKRLRAYPRKAINAHPLQGAFEGLWSCHLSKNPDIVLVYAIDDKNKKILVLRIGSHSEVY